MSHGRLLATLSLIRLDDGTVTIGTTGVTNLFNEELAHLSVAVNGFAYAKLLIVEAAGRMAAEDRVIAGAHLRPVN